ncbi:emp24/gp25L/p24 family of membrane trafficking protein [Scheffersomyces xylosifermentans]|uniref:emp24/gp25L/p24 family of membrane trafficking protein n=1 Tax=Scheffersomyces xylosifermentans TaxID=1304137 RepID=UPI00315D40D3
MTRLLFLLLVVAYYLHPVLSLLHFYANAGERTCFYKELAHGSLLIGKYKVEIQDPDSEIYYIPRDRVNNGALIDVEETFDSNHRVVHQKGAAIGQFTFTALDTGDHRICITPKSFFSKKWYGHNAVDKDLEEFAIKDSKFKKARVTVDFLIGDASSIDSKHSAQVKTLSDQVNRLNDKLIDIRREQKFIREKEASFRDLSERTCDRVVRWSVVQLGALIVTCVYQLVSLSRMFIKEKIQ